jgi:hypothetical protein
MGSNREGNGLSPGQLILRRDYLTEENKFYLKKKHWLSVRIAKDVITYRESIV